MKFIKKALGLTVVLVIIGIVFYFLGAGLKDVSLESFELSGIDDISAESFTIIGNFLVNNPSDLSVPVKSVDYDVVLKKTNDNIGNGKITTFTLSANEISTLPFNQQINWVPTVTLAKDLLLEEKVIAIVSGELKINLPKIDEYAIPFSSEVDIKDYVKQFVPVEVPKVLGETTSKVNDNLPLDDDSKGDLANVPLNNPNEDSMDDTIPVGGLI